MLGGFMTIETSPKYQAENTDPIDIQPLLLDVRNTTLYVTPAQFDLLCLDNPDLHLELTAQQELIVMAPAFPISGKQNLNLGSQVYAWNEQTELGETFDSSTGYDFTAIGGGRLSSDVSWIEKCRLEGVSLEQFCPVVPDFVVELRSSTDRLSALQAKMLEYQRLGVRLGLLVNPQSQQVEVYRLGQNIEILESPMSVSCDDVLPGFMLKFNKIW
jgi:Uma2 family endonuclease